MTLEEQKIVDLGRAIERLREEKDFQMVIEEAYINDQALSIGRDFYATEDQLDTLKAVSALRSWLQTNVEDGKIIINSN